MPWSSKGMGNVCCGCENSISVGAQKKARGWSKGSHSHPPKIMITAGVVSPQERWRVHKHAVNNVDSALNLLTGKVFVPQKLFSQEDLPLCLCSLSIVCPALGKTKPCKNVCNDISTCKITNLQNKPKLFREPCQILTCTQFQMSTCFP